MHSYDMVKQALAHITLPRFHKVQFALRRAPEGFDAAAETRSALLRQGVLEPIRPGQRVAVSVSSREISQHAAILRALVDLLKERGAEPFLFPAMGSHGGATAQGQRQVAEGYGITEEAMGCPLHSSMETVLVGRTPGKGLPVYIDKHALEADHMIPVGRVKPHTDFRGPVESGLMKMLTIGFGKQQGAFLCHQQGWPDMADNVMEIAGYILDTQPIPFGLGIIEDSMHHVAEIHAVPAGEIPAREPALLQTAKDYIPKIPFPKVDILIVDEIGKDISGAGMDPNVTGRSTQMGRSAPFVERIMIRSLTAKAKHNAAGVGNADVITKRLFDEINMPDSYINAITSHDPKGCMIPPVMPDDETALRYAFELTMGAGSQGPMVVWIKNTSKLDEFYISENLLEQARENPLMEVSRNAQAIRLDGGDFSGFETGFDF